MKETHLRPREYNEASLIEGPSGKTIAMLRPVMTVRMHTLALQQAHETIKHLEQSGQLTLDKAVFETKALEEIYSRRVKKKRWTIGQIWQVANTLENMKVLQVEDKALPYGSVERVAPVYMVVNDSGWLNREAADMQLGNYNGTTAGDPGRDLSQWGWIGTENNQACPLEMIDQWCLRGGLVLWSQKSRDDPDVLRQYAVDFGVKHRTAGKPHPVKPDFFTPLDRKHWNNTIRLAEGVSSGEVVMYNHKGNSLEPLLDATGVVVCFNTKEDSESGYLNSQHGISRDLGLARVFKSVDDAKRSIKAMASGSRGSYLIMDEATFLKVELRVKGYIPQPEPVSQGLGKILISWFQKLKLDEMVKSKTLAEDNEEGGPQAPSPKL